MFRPNAFVGMDSLHEVSDAELLHRAEVAAAIERHPAPYTLLPGEWSNLAGKTATGKRYVCRPATHPEHGIVHVNKAGGFYPTFVSDVTLDDPPIGWLSPSGGLAICDLYQHSALACAICDGLGVTVADESIYLEDQGYVKIVKVCGAYVALHASDAPTEAQARVLMMLGVGACPD
jgi:hypothetical protein